MGDEWAQVCRRHRLYDAVAFYSTGLGDTHSHDVEIFTFATAGDEDLVHKRLNIDTALYLR